MKQTVTVRPHYSILFIEDVAGGDNTPAPPAKDDPAQAWATPGCVMFHILPEPDGPTEITLGLRQEVDPGSLPKFTGEIATPSRAVHIVEVDDTLVLDMPVPTASTRVSIWFSHPKWPDRVIVGLG